MGATKLDIGGVLLTILGTTFLLLLLFAMVDSQREINRNAQRLEARVRALEARRPVDLHVTVARPEEAAQAVYNVLPQAGWTGR